MKAKHKKELQQDYAKKNIDFFLELASKNSSSTYSKNYIQEVLKFSTAFNIRLQRNQKLLFCKKCLTPWNVETRKIRLDKKNSSKNYICNNCGFIKRIPFK